MKLMPGFLADARILEDLHQRQYQHEEKAFASLKVGTIIIILISVLGMFSLSLYMSIKRMKGFGIRKVLVLRLDKLPHCMSFIFLKSFSSQMWLHCQ
jgi:hypothetical protein